LDLRQLLKNHPTFEIASDRKRDVLAAAMQIISVPPGRTIVEQGQPGEGLYLVMEGTARTTQTDDDAGLLRTKELGEGDLFGLLGLVPDMPSPATVTAATGVRAAMLSRYAYEQLFASAPALARQLQYMVAIELARALQDRNRALRTLLRKNIAPA
jgi:CRP-like cAMP-binding protein